MLTVLDFTLNRFRFLKTSEKLVLSELLSSENDLLRLDIRELQKLIGRRVSGASWTPNETALAGCEDCDYCSRRGIGAVKYTDPGYPPQLREIYDPPFLLFWHGKLSDNGTPHAAVVGTRKPDGRAKDAAFRLGADFARAAVPVVSGLARGIDSEAHRGAVKAGGATIAVLGCGIDTVYPKENKGLAREILSCGGALISEYSPGTPPLRYNFPERNRIISGLSRTVIVVQAPARSGALITADYALEQGRDLVVCGGGLEGSAGCGGKDLADAGAQVISGASDVLKEWGRDPGNPPCSDRDAETADRTGDVSGGKLDLTGRDLASSLEQELLGTIVRNRGEAV